MNYHNFKDWLQLAEELGLAKVVLQNEMELTGSTAEQVYEKMAERWQVMQASAEKALNNPQEMPLNLISGQAKKQYDYHGTGGYCGDLLNLMMARALSCSEVNAAMGRICAAPTAGSCGIVPAVIWYAAKRSNADEKRILDALLVAAGVGAVITKNATVAGAEGGCQVECGTAAAMGAAAAVYLAGGSPKMALNAVSIALINCMGLVCDPIAGLVQMPCSFRNASQAMNAVLSADLALAGQDPVIEPDEAVEAMYRVGKYLPPELRETALGGIAATRTGKELKKALRQEAVSLS